MRNNSMREITMNGIIPDFNDDPNGFDDDDDPISTIDGFPIGGRMQTYSGMVNLIRDLPQARLANWTPYLGGGLGFSFVDAKMTMDLDAALRTQFSSFAFQEFAGASRPLTLHSEFFAEYQFFSGDEFRMSIES